MKNEYRTHTLAHLSPALANHPVRLSGWVQRKRDHGGLLFVELRDNYGLVQLVVNPANAGDAMGVLEHVPLESVICVDGMVVKRSPETVNEAMASGDIEIVVNKAEILSRAEELPMPIVVRGGEADYPEEIRLKHRYLDLNGSYKSFTVHTESWWASANPLDEDVVEEIMVGLYHKDGGTSGEFPFVWRKVGQHVWVRLEAWNDGWAALVNMPELLQLMHDLDDDAGSNGNSISPQEFVERLKAIGFRDKTVRRLEDRGGRSP